MAWVDCTGDVDRIPVFLRLGIRLPTFSSRPARACLLLHRSSDGWRDARGGADTAPARLFGEDIKVETVLSAGLWKTNVHPRELENTLLNLSVNARDAIPGGGKLTIETANAQVDDICALDGTVPPRT